jgi:hypothetical protein
MSNKLKAAALLLGVPVAIGLPVAYFCARKSREDPSPRAQGPNGLLFAVF